MIASIAWGIVGMLVGVLIATQFGVWQANFNTSWLTFGRLRPLHTNAVIFASVGNMMFAGIYYSTQRLIKVRAEFSKPIGLSFVAAWRHPGFSQDRQSRLKDRRPTF